MYKETPIYNISERSLKFSIQIMQLVRILPKDTLGLAIGNQIIRSGTSVGANIEEAQNCGSKKEFIHTMTVSLKEARETQYWLKIIIESGLIDKQKVIQLLEECTEIVKILTAIVKNSKK